MRPFLIEVVCLIYALSSLTYSGDISLVGMQHSSHSSNTGGNPAATTHVVRTLEGPAVFSAPSSDLSAKIINLQTKYKNLLPDAVETQKVVYLRDINRMNDYLRLVEGKVTWSQVEETVDADQAAYEEECQDDWAIHDDLYDEEQEIVEQLQYHFEEN